MTWETHRISTIELTKLATHYPRTVGRNARLGSHGSGGTSTVAVVRTDQGELGWGLVEGGVERNIDAVREQLVGQELGALFDPATGVTDDRALPLDIALHDLVAILLEVPVHQLLGGAGTQEVICYSGAIYFDDLDPEDNPRGLAAVLENCASDYAAGFRDFKLKIGRGNRWMELAAGLRRDIEVTRAVREAYPDARLLVDANDGYSVDQMITYLRAVRDCDLYWVEEPFAENAADLRKLRDYLRESGLATYIADGEFQPDVEHLLELARDGLFDLALMDVATYGITAWRRMMPILAELGVLASPHAWGRPLKTRYAAQLAAGLGNVPIVEGVPGTTDGVDETAYRFQDGVLTVPDNPGFGIHLREMPS